MVQLCHSDSGGIGKGPRKRFMTRESLAAKAATRGPEKPCPAGVTGLDNAKALPAGHHTYAGKGGLWGIAAPCR